ncbi:MAG: IPT/TIG domain-containing protein [Verrucomicrobia bacterium]|nr:IPT/TIG domain-containing protein [Verrucomicrobiota bacterium]
MNTLATQINFTTRPSSPALLFTLSGSPQTWLGALVAWLALATLSVTAQNGTPVITKFAPASGAPGIRVTITGANFTGAQLVTFNGAVADFVLISPTQINATVPFDATTGPVSVDTSAGQAISTAFFFVAPVITDFTPDNGPPGTFVTVSGANFDNAMAVKFGGVNAPNFAVVASGQLQAVVPAGAASGPISVITPAGGAVSTNQFFVTTAPIITGFDPPDGAPGTTVVIDGDRFLGATAVKFNGTNANFTVVAVTQIRAIVPPKATTGPITVMSALGTGASSSNFVVTGSAPVISDFNPKHGQPGDAVVIDGRNFTSATAVSFGGTNAVFAVVADTQIQAVVPARATNGLISVTGPAGAGFSTNIFQVTGPAPIVTDFSPAFGLAGSQVVIDGENFLGATGVTFNGTNATFAVTSPNQITAIVPKTATDGPIAVTSPGGSGVSSSVFNVITGGPVITDFSPTAGAPGATVVVNGANFTSVTNVTFGGVQATNFGVTADTQLRVTVPAGANTGPIQAVNLFGTGTSKTNFIAAPRITSFTPPSAPVGSTITVTGTNLLDATIVLLNGLKAKFTTVTQNQLGFVVPPGAASGPISLANPGGATSTTNDFIVTLAADLGLSVIMTPPVAILGGSLNYFFTITNRGPDTATHVTLAGSLPGNAIFLASNASQGACAANLGQIVCGLGPIAAGAVATVQLQFLPSSEGGSGNTFNLLAVEPDPALADNSLVVTAIIVPGGLPSLRIQIATGQAVLSWATTNAGFILEGTDTLMPPISWFAISNAVSMPGLNSFTSPLTNATRFFRLRKP